MRTVLVVLMLLLIELAVAVVLLGTWVSEGRRRAEELERIEGMLRAAGAVAPPEVGSDAAADRPA